MRSASVGVSRMKCNTRLLGSVERLDAKKKKRKTAKFQNTYQRSCIKLFRYEEFMCLMICQSESYKLRTPVCLQILRACTVERFCWNVGANGWTRRCSISFGQKKHRNSRTFTIRLQKPVLQPVPSCSPCGYAHAKAEKSIHLLTYEAGKPLNKTSLSFGKIMLQKIFIDRATVTFFNLLLRVNSWKLISKFITYINQEFIFNSKQNLFQIRKPKIINPIRYIEDRNNNNNNICPCFKLYI